MIGTIGFLVYFGEKLINWGILKGYDLTFKEIMQKLAPESVAILEAEAKTLLQPATRDDIDVLVLEVTKAAEANPQFKVALEALGIKTQENVELEKVVRELISTLKNQPSNTHNIGKIANTVEKVGVANVNSTIETQNNTINL